MLDSENMESASAVGESCRSQDCTAAYNKKQQEEKWHPVALKLPSFAGMA